MPFLRTSVSQFALVDGRRRNHTESIACREPSRLPFGPGRAHLYLLAEHAAADGHEHRLCQVVMREVQLAFVAEEGAGTPAALARAVEVVNRSLWEGGQDLPPHRRLPIGLVAVAVEGADAYLCQVATGQAFVGRGERGVGVPSFAHWRELHTGAATATPALGQTPDLTPLIHRCRLAPGDLIVLSSTNLARLIDLPTLTALAAQPGETVVTRLCRLAEDYGLQHTSGMALQILATPGPEALPQPLMLEPLTPALVEELAAAAPHGLAGRLGQVLRRAPTGLAAERAAPRPEHAGALAGQQPESPAPVQEALPENVVRLYETPPLASLAAAEPVAAEPDPAPLAASRPAPAMPARPRSARWLDALAASMVIASETLRRPAPPPRRSGARRAARPRPVRGSASRPAAPEPVYRAVGALAPAGVDGFGSPAAVGAAVPRWPGQGGNSVAVVAMIAVATLLLLAAVNLLRPALLPTLQSPAEGGASIPAPAQPTAAALVDAPATGANPVDQRAAPEPLAAPTANPLYGPPAPVSVAPASPPVSAPAATPVAAPASADRSPATRGAGPAAGEADSRGRLGAVTVLADLGASGTPPTTPKQLIVGRGSLYVLDPYSSTLYLIEAAGKAPTPLLARGWSIGKEKVTDLVGATWRGDTLVVMDRGRAYTLDGPNGTWRVAPLAAGGLGAGVHPVASFDGSLYILASAKSQVLKFAQGAYQKAPRPWLKLPDKVDLAGAVDLAIDGRIYALTASGQLLTLFRGDLEKRQAIEATPALQSPAALISPANSPYLYVAEAGGRILRLTKDGTVVAQFRPAEGDTNLAGLSDLWVDEGTRTIYAVVGNRIVRLALPDQGRDYPLT